MKYAFALIVLSLVTVPTAQAKDKKADRIATLLSTTDGAAKQTAYKVASVDEEYQILRARHLRPTSQSLIVGEDKHPYYTIDVITEDGKTLSLWFDIKSFYGRGFFNRLSQV